jgi:hypothetical protein
MFMQQGRRIAAVMVMVLGAALIGYGAHYLIQNGACSPAGHTSAGPAPACGGGGEGPYTLSVLFLGPALAIAGWRLGRLRGALWPATCIALGAGLVTIHVGPGATAVARAFGPVAGTCFLGFALASAVAIAARRLRARISPAGRPVVQVSPTGQGTTVVVYRPASGARERDLDSLEGCAVAHVAGGSRAERVDVRAGALELRPPALQ